jgi:Family of unknown function (DUF6629)
MCFSPEADLVGGVAVTVIGVDALRHVRHGVELPLAALPVLLGAHQLIETFVWWQLQGHVSDAVGTVATWAYLLIALVVLPPYVPFAIRAIEPTPARRALIVPFMVIGGAVAATLLVSMVRHPISATMGTHHLVYHVYVPYPVVLFPAYVVATCGPLLVSGYRHTVVFGAVNLPVVVLLAVAERNGLASLWCAWAAVTSVIIAAHLRHRRWSGGWRSIATAR